MEQTKLPFKNVEDATDHLILEVLPKDIRGANLRNPSACATARACKRQLGKEAKIHLSRVYIKESDTWRRYLVPMSLRGEIISFDRGGMFIPGKYTLSPPYPTAKLGADRRNRPSRKRQAYKKHYKVTTDVRTGPVRTL